MKTRTLQQRVDSFIAKNEAAGTLPPGAGLAVSVLKDGDVIFSGGFGLRERDRNLPVTPETVFEICSSTKAFLSTALVMASEQGFLDLDRPINSARTLLPLKDPDIAKKITVSDILSHRTGLPAYDLLWYFGPVAPEKLLQTMGRLDFAPGAFRQSFTYNNLMYGALGQLFQELTGENWESYVARKILAPLGMNSTSFSVSQTSPNVALPYVGTRHVERTDMSAVAAAGAMKSTLEDMTRWMLFHLSGGTSLSGERLVTPSSMERMHSKEIVIENPNPILFQGLEWLGERLEYGLGWFIGATQNLKAVYHPGFVDGFSTALVMIPEKKLGCVVMSNLNLSGVPGLLAQELLTSLLEDSETARAGDMPTEDQLSAVGSYENAAFGKLAVTLHEENLVLNYNGVQWPITWRGSDAADFVMTAFGLQIPMSVQFGRKDSKVDQLSIPFSMDPRVAPQIFT